MSDLNEKPAAPTGASPIELPKYRYVSPEEFAASTGANVGFTPAHPREWMHFWHHDVCMRERTHTEFPLRSLPEARRVWLAMEAVFFAQYDYCLRVWPEYASSGIWTPPYPGSLAAGGMVEYEELRLPTELVERFRVWHAEFEDSTPGLPDDKDWDCFYRVADKLACDLKGHVGPRIYVEREELLEVLMDGTTRSWRRRLGLPESE